LNKINHDLRDQAININHSIKRSVPVAGALLGVFLWQGIAGAATQQATWNGGLGNWDTVASWSGGVVPINGQSVGTDTYSVSIDDGATGVNSSVTVNVAGIVIDSLAIDVGDTLNIGNDFVFTIQQNAGRPDSGSVVNNGSLRLSAANGAMPRLIFDGNATLSGTGVLELNDDDNNRLEVTGNSILTNDVNHTIRGIGGLFIDNGNLINKGTIIGQGTNDRMDTRTLAMIPGVGGVTNDGVMRAVNTGAMVLRQGVYTNTNGLIEAIGNFSIVEIWEGAVIEGGTLSSEGTSFLFIDTQDDPQGLTPATFTNVTVATGSTVMFSNSLVKITDHHAQVNGTLTNNGTWELNSTGSNHEHIFIFNNNATLTGTGVVQMMGNAATNLIRTDGSVLTQEAGHTISGGGRLLDNSGGLINRGTILADQAGPLTIDPGASGVQNHGTMQATGSGGLILQNGAFTNESGGQIIVDTTVTVMGLSTLTNKAGATVSGNGTIVVENGSTFSNAGVVSPGASAGTLRVTGAYTQTSTGSLQVELGGTSAGNPTEYDQLIVTGDVSLDGTLDISLINGFMPTYNDEFRVLGVLSQGVRSGQFGTITGASIDNTMTLAPIYDHNGTVGLTLIAALPGDANLDGTVNGDDLLVWQANLFTGNQWAQGDFNIDGTVNGDDLLVWQAHLFDSILGPTFSPLSSPVPIPEPATGVILVIGTAWAAARKSRDRYCCRG